eukprot:scaffold115632_cov50-Cyclotella_meneghiniana.AAC.1
MVFHYLISRSTYLSFSKTSYLRMVWYIGRRAAATVDPKPQVDKPSDGTSHNSPAAKQAPVRAKQTLGMGPLVVGGPLVLGRLSGRAQRLPTISGMQRAGSLPRSSSWWVEREGTPRKM